MRAKSHTVDKDRGHWNFPGSHGLSRAGGAEWRPGCHHSKGLLGVNLGKHDRARLMSLAYKPLTGPGEAGTWRGALHTLEGVGNPLGEQLGHSSGGRWGETERATVIQR